MIHMYKPQRANPEADPDYLTPPEILEEGSKFYLSDEQLNLQVNCLLFLTNLMTEEHS